MKEVFILDGVRTAVGRFCGSLQNVSAVELGRAVTEALFQRNQLNPESVDEVVFGNVLSAGLGQNVARQIAVKAGMPETKTALSINMVCGSGLRAVCLGAQSIKCGDAGIVVAGGTENMSAAPFLLKKARSGHRLGHDELTDSIISDGLSDAFSGVHMGITAENLAEKYHITREMQDAYAAQSQNRAEQAISKERFKPEIVPVTITRDKKKIEFDEDEFPRKGVTPESLAHLAPAFKADGTVTAGNSSGINDQAAALLLTGKEGLQAFKRPPMAKIVSYAWHGINPAIMGIGPVEAVRKALKMANWSMNELELIEANEAFAVQTIAVGMDLNWNDKIVNVNGGAIALGHPIGASGARILVTLLYEMKRRNVRKGLATLCIGGGMGIAMCVEQI